MKQIKTKEVFREISEFKNIAFSQIFIKLSVRRLKRAQSDRHQAASCPEDEASKIPDGKK